MIFILYLARGWAMGPDPPPKRPLRHPNEEKACRISSKWVRKAGSGAISREAGNGAPPPQISRQNRQKHAATRLGPFRVSTLPWGKAGSGTIPVKREWCPAVGITL